ncbi:hypothetical protein J2S57_004992 [Kineosporia succinea]|uniref:Uncharacterized protein n=1 Tax=Kineosporia succinea TaxID=84632 RepID=A0ABT9P966_9ACTN|nr:hypothetical protein [Kineosporia succinea]
MPSAAGPHDPTSLRYTAHQTVPSLVVRSLRTQQCIPNPTPGLRANRCSTLEQPPRNQRSPEWMTVIVQAMAYL